MSTPIDFENAYERLAEHVAKRYGNSLITHGNTEFMQALVNCWPEVFDWIEADIPAWEAKVNSYLHAQASEGVPEL